MNTTSFARIRIRFATIASALTLVAALSADGLGAQATGLPTFFAPTRGYAAAEIGATLSRPGGDATGLEGRLGFGLDQADLALRVGYFDPGEGAEGILVAGAEARLPVLGRTADFPLDGALIFGFGRHFRSGAEQNFWPVGLSLGRRISVDRRAFQLTPYLQPTVIFEDSTLFAFGLGVDVAIRGIPEVRVNWGLGDMDGFSVGLFWAN